MYVRPHIMDERMDESDYGAQIILDADLMDDTIDLGPGSVSNLSCYPPSGEFTMPPSNVR